MRVSLIFAPLPSPLTRLSLAYLFSPVAKAKVILVPVGVSPMVAAVKRMSHRPAFSDCDDSTIVSPSLVTLTSSCGK